MIYENLAKASEYVRANIADDGEIFTIYQADDRSIVLMRWQKKPDQEVSGRDVCVVCNWNGIAAYQEDVALLDMTFC